MRIDVDKVYTGLDNSSFNMMLQGCIHNFLHENNIFLYPNFIETDKKFKVSKETKELMKKHGLSLEWNIIVDFRYEVYHYRIVSKNDKMNRIFGDIFTFLLIVFIVLIVVSLMIFIKINNKNY